MSKRAIYNMNPEAGLAGSDVGQVIETLAKRHKVSPRQIEIDAVIANRLRLFLSGIGAIVDSTNFCLDKSKIRGINVLDLACGTTKTSPVISSTEPCLKRTMEPWLCRALASLGANVTGVDIFYPVYKPIIKKGKIRGEQQYTEPHWRFVQRDLTVPGALDVETFPDGSFHAVAAMRFIESETPSMDAAELQSLRARDPLRYQEVVREIFQQVQRVLREGGIFVCDRTVHKKDQDQLVVSAYL